MANFVGLLQEKCQKYKKDRPKFFEEESCGLKKCICQLYSWTTEGVGCNKKIAKQNAAESMLKIVVNDSKFTEFEPKDSQACSSTSAATKVDLFADRYKKEKPLYSQKMKENDLFVAECTFDGFSAVGKGSSKKLAKEEALKKIVDHFDIHTFYTNFLKEKTRKQESKNPVQNLQELCQRRQLELSFHEEEINSDFGKTLHFVVSCSVNDLTTKSKPSFSKRYAKAEAADLMIVLLNNTPLQSPLHTSANDYNQPMSEGQASSDESTNQSQKDAFDKLLPEADLSDDESPLVKRKKKVV